MNDARRDDLRPERVDAKWKCRGGEDGRDVLTARRQRYGTADRNAGATSPTHRGLPRKNEW
jgi:hypothetical protein